jgi:prepilin-type N-terminal cleavage/methylation domain-containing protein
MIAVEPDAMVSRRSGFTLIELLSVVGIIGLLVAMLLPALLSSRGTARRTQCLSQLRQIGLALHAHEARQQYYPGWSNRVFGKTRHDDTRLLASWITTILPDLEEVTLAEVNRTAVGGAPPVSVPALVCPDDRATTGEVEAVVSYAGNGGIEDYSFGRAHNDLLTRLDSRANGVFMI